jgi:hypothetical protein
MPESNAILLRFLDDYKIPIQIVQNPYFEYFLDLYDSYLGTKVKYSLFQETVRLLGGEQEFYKYASDLVHKVVDHVKSKQEYCGGTFGELTVLLSQITRKSVGNQSMYSVDNNDKHYVSVDLKNANFQSLKRANNKLVDSKDTYSAFIQQFTCFEYFCESKHIRQVIFGNLNPARQQNIQRILLGTVLDCFKEYHWIDETKICQISSDEFVFESNDSLPHTGIVESVVRKYTGVDTRVRKFRLGVILDKYFVKEYEDNGYEIRGVPAYYFAQVFKAYNKMKLHDNDLLFYMDGHLAKFVNALAD